MSRKVQLTKIAETQLGKLFEYLENSWPEKVKSDFSKKLDECVSRVKFNPNLFPRSFIKNGLHRCVVSKQTSFYYIHDETTITILAVFDTRQSPEKLMDQIVIEET